MTAPILPRDTGRRAFYRDLGTKPRRPEPSAYTSVTQHVLRGTLDHEHQADAAYTMHSMTVRFRLGPVFIVLQGREAARSARDLCRELLPALEALFPDLGSELERQMARRAALNGK